MKEIKAYLSHFSDYYCVANRVREAIVEGMKVLGKDDESYNSVLADFIIATKGLNIKDLKNIVEEAEKEAPRYMLYPYDGCGGLTDPYGFDTLDEVIDYCEYELSYTDLEYIGMFMVYDLKNKEYITNRVMNYLDTDRKHYAVVDYMRVDLKFITDDIEQAKNVAREWLKKYKLDEVYVCDRLSTESGSTHEIWYVNDEEEGDVEE